MNYDPPLCMFFTVPKIIDVPSPYKSAQLPQRLLELLLRAEHFAVIAARCENPLVLEAFKGKERGAE